ncbi:hypothetical protein TNCV_4419591 [Trichonephila clavipes]|nr:hypothetical protein TNCV_4419591 [Trichonephila clavipes]
MGYARETNCSPLAPLKLHYRTEESSPRSLEPFEPTTHSSSHSKLQQGRIDYLILGSVIVLKLSLGESVIDSGPG